MPKLCLLHMQYVPAVVRHCIVIPCNLVPLLDIFKFDEIFLLVFSLDSPGFQENGSNGKTSCRFLYPHWVQYRQILITCFHLVPSNYPIYDFLKNFLQKPEMNFMWKISIKSAN